MTGFRAGRLIGSSVFLSLFLSLSLWAAENTTVDRKVMPEIIKLLGSPYTLERIDGIRRAAGLSDKALVTEFKIVPNLVRIATNRSGFARERSEALQALVQFAITQVISSDELLEHIRKIIRDPKDKLEVRIDALRLLADFGSVPIEQRDLKMVALIERLYTMVKEIAEDRSDKGSTLLRGSSLVALGAIAGNKAIASAQRKDAEKTILSSMRDESPLVRTAAMEALLFYIDSSQNNDPLLFSRILESVTKGDRVSDGVNLSAIKAVEVMLGYETPLTASMLKDLTEYLLVMISKGSDDELVAASRCLLRIRDQKLLIGFMELFIAELTKRDHEMHAQQALVMGLVEMVGPLGMMVEEMASTSAVEKRRISKAVDEVTGFLAKLVSSKTAKMELRLLGASGVGSIPLVFNRVTAVEVMISVLKDEVGGNANGGKSSPLANEIVASLVQIARGKAFVTKEGDIDLAKWEQWLEKNKKLLVPEKAPWMGGEGK